MAKQPPFPSVLTTAKLVELVGIGADRLAQIEQIGGFIQRDGRNRWPAGPTLVGLVRFYRSDERRSARSEAESRVRDARAQYLEARTAEKLRQLILIDDALEVLAVRCGLVRQEAEGQPARVGGRDLVLRRRIADDVDGMLHRVSAALDKAAASLRDGGEGLENFLKGRGLADLARSQASQRGRNGADDEDEEAARRLP
jgi:hypothetical protein